MYTGTTNFDAADRELNKLKNMRNVKFGEGYCGWVMYLKDAGCPWSPTNTTEQNVEQLDISSLLWGFDGCVSLCQLPSCRGSAADTYTYRQWYLDDVVSYYWALCEGKSTGHQWIPIIKGQACGALMSSWLLAWISYWYAVEWKCHVTHCSCFEVFLFYIDGLVLKHWS